MRQYIVLTVIFLLLGIYP